MTIIIGIGSLINVGTGIRITKKYRHHHICIDNLIIALRRKGYKNHTGCPLPAISVADLINVLRLALRAYVHRNIV